MFKNELMNSGIVRYFWDPEPKYNEESGIPIWCLGREYTSPPPKSVSTTEHGDIVEIASPFAESHPPSETTTSTDSTSPESTASVPPPSSSFDDASIVDGDVPSMNNQSAEGGWPSAFLDDFESRLWITYRSNFPPIPRSHDPSAASSMTFAVRLRNLADREGFSSDTGWGCMIRSGQSLLANALTILHQGRDWRRQRKQKSTEEGKIMSLFADDPRAPFSIHRFVQHGATACGKYPGQWFGPSATASCIKALSTECASAGLRVYVTSDSSDVYEDTFRTIAADQDGQVQPTLILLGIRLGPDRITPVYYEALKSTLTYPQSIGIAGGRPSSSHYFVGCQGDSFFYLDPHETRPALPFRQELSEYTEEELASVHTRRLRSIRISEMDPSMLLGFLIRDDRDWKDWKRRISDVKGKAIVRVSDKAPPGDGEAKEREEAVDEVETFDDDDDDDDGTEDEEDRPKEVWGF